MSLETPNNNEATTNPIQKMIADSELLRDDALTAKMVEDGFVGPNNETVDPDEWLEKREQILSEGIPQINPAEVAEGGVIHSNPAERQLSDEGGLPEKEVA